MAMAYLGTADGTRYLGKVQYRGKAILSLPQILSRLGKVLGMPIAAVADTSPVADSADTWPVRPPCTHSKFVALHLGSRLASSCLPSTSPGHSLPSNSVTKVATPNLSAQGQFCFSSCPVHLCSPPVLRVTITSLLSGRAQLSRANTNKLYLDTAAVPVPARRSGDRPALTLSVSLPHSLLALLLPPPPPSPSPLCLSLSLPASSSPSTICSPPINCPSTHDFAPSHTSQPLHRHPWPHHHHHQNGRVSNTDFASVANDWPVQGGT